jgi:alkanesulfonate monooxygenase SsuD/methylene tetrahydromethanopterin reductase-like flavin-dependent oxidoreductase (luciferase family)
VRGARRADGWLPVSRPGRDTFDPEAQIVRPLKNIRQLAEQYGRDPLSIRTVLRVSPNDNHTVDEIVETLTRAEQEAGVDSAFVDFQTLTATVDQTKKLTEQVYTRFRGN